MDLTRYMTTQYPAPPCWALVADVYARELGQGVDDYRTINPSARAIAAAFRLALHKSAHGFEPVTAPAAPADFDVVLLGKAASLGLHHCGVYWQGGVLHALETGAVYQDLASLRDTYPLMEFWRKAPAVSLAPAAPDLPPEQPAAPAPEVAA